MKTLKIKYLQFVVLLAFTTVAFLSCERDLSDDIVPAGFPTTSDIFTDNPVGLTDQFFRSFDPGAGANTNGFGVDDNVAYEGTTSIRIDVPGSNDPDGNFIGGVFEDRGAGRNLTGYNALTFWARGSTSSSVTFGFGTDFDKTQFEPSYAVSTVVELSTSWKKVVIPIPDASKLVQEKGLFLFSAGGADPSNDGPNGNEVAWTFWMDELRFENLGSIGQHRPFINNGQDQVGVAFVGETLNILGIGVTSNLSNGQDVTTTTSADYFSFSSSNSSVAQANLSEVALVGDGTAVITAELAGTAASGSLTVNSTPVAPVPTLPAADVISVFSDAYTNRPVDYFNGYWQWSTTQGQDDIDINGNKIIKYTDLNFVGTEFQGARTIDASQMTHFHIDLYIENTIRPGDFLRIILQDLGSDNVFGGGNDRAGEIRLTSTSSTPLVNGSWVSVDVPFSSFPGLTTRSNLAQIVYVSDGTIPTVFVDNIYFHK